MAKKSTKLKHWKGAVAERLLAIAAKRNPQSRKTEATMINVGASEARDAALGERIDKLEARIAVLEGENTTLARLTRPNWTR